MAYAEFVREEAGPEGIPWEEADDLVAAYVRECLPAGKLLVLPPDLSRLHSGAGRITDHIYRLCREAGREMHVMPALGTHEPMTDGEIRRFFGHEIPLDRFITHDWKRDVVTVGQVPGDYVRDVSGGLMQEPFRVEVNRRILSGEYAAVLSVGQVVPHEVVGFANYTKNILVGAGGSDMINKTHYLAAVVGMENILGRADTPVRRIFDYAEESLLRALPIHYLLTVTTSDRGEVRLHGLYGGRSRGLFERAAAMSAKKNITFVERPIKKCVVYLDPDEFRSTWIGNKATYRTRMAIADGGELVILAPGVSRFGEDEENDRLIRKYGYVGREKAMELTRNNRDLRECLSVAGQIIQGSSEGRFRVTWCTRLLSREEVESVGFSYLPYEQAAARYDTRRLAPGFSVLADGEEIYYIPNPAVGLWSLPIDHM